MRNSRSWKPIVLVVVVAMATLGIVFWLLSPVFNSGIGEVEELSGLKFPEGCEIKYLDPGFDGRAFYVLQLSDASAFSLENHLNLNSFQDHGYLESQVQEAALLPSPQDSLASFASPDPKKKLHGILCASSGMLWLTVHYMDHSGDGWE